jgi:hypothetical protein
LCQSRLLRNGLLAIGLEAPAALEVQRSKSGAIGRGIRIACGVGWVERSETHRRPQQAARCGRTNAPLILRASEQPQPSESFSDPIDSSPRSGRQSAFPFAHSAGVMAGS